MPGSGALTRRRSDLPEALRSQSEGFRLCGRSYDRTRSAREGSRALLPLDDPPLDRLEAVSVVPLELHGWDPTSTRPPVDPPGRHAEEFRQLVGGQERSRPRRLGPGAPTTVSMDALGYEESPSSASSRSVSDS